LFVLSIVVVAMLLLSIGLSELEFLPGRPFFLGYSSGSFEGMSEPWQTRFLGVVFRVLIIGVVLFVPFSIVYVLSSRKARKRLLLDFLRLFVILVSVYVLLQRLRPDIFAPDQVPPQAFLDIPEGALAADVDVVLPGWFPLVINVGLALFVAAVLVGLGWFVWRRRRRTVRSLEQLAQPMEEAIEAIHAGADLRGTVMRCYYEMSRVLRQQRGIRRQQAMTPREFVAFLQRAGLPTEAVGRLTELFERVRYGGKAAGREEEVQALACLETIVAFCKSAG
jgi:hypothetical protein